MLFKGSKTTGMLPTKGLELSEGSRSIAEPGGCGTRTRAAGRAQIFWHAGGKNPKSFFFFLLGKRKKNLVFAENLQMVLSASGNALETAP